MLFKYEQDAYESMRKQMPRPGREVYTPDGSGTVLENNVITERTRVKVVLDDGTFDVREYPFRELRLKSSPPSMKISEEDASFTQEEDPALLSLEDGASSAYQKEKMLFQNKKSLHANSKSAVRPAASSRRKAVCLWLQKQLPLLKQRAHRGAGAEAAADANATRATSSLHRQNSNENSLEYQAWPS